MMLLEIEIVQFASNLLGRIARFQVTKEIIPQGGS
jgi:hypothetical protein